MSEPTISLQTTATMTATGFTDDDQVISYLLYADDYYFENWTDWVNDSANSPNNNQLQNAANYSNYVWKMYCELEAVNNACGFYQQNQGAYWIVSNTDGEIAAVSDTSTATSNTVAMTKDEYSDWEGNLADFSSDNSSIISNTSIADPYF